MSKGFSKMTGCDEPGFRTFFAADMMVAASICASSKRDVDGHLVAVEVGVEGGTHERMELDGVAFDQGRPERWMPWRCRVGARFRSTYLALDHLFEDGPHFRDAFFDEASRATDVVGELALHQLRDDERTEELERHLLRQSALIERESGPRR